MVGVNLNCFPGTWEDDGFITLMPAVENAKAGENRNNPVAMFMTRIVVIRFD